MAIAKTVALQATRGDGALIAAGPVPLTTGGLSLPISHRNGTSKRNRRTGDEHGAFGKGLLPRISVGVGNKG